MNRQPMITAKKYVVGDNCAKAMGESETTRLMIAAVKQLTTNTGTIASFLLSTTLRRWAIHNEQNTLKSVYKRPING